MLVSFWVCDLTLLSFLSPSPLGRTLFGKSVLFSAIYSLPFEPPPFCFVTLGHAVPAVRIDSRCGHRDAVLFPGDTLQADALDYRTEFVCRYLLEDDNYRVESALPSIFPSSAIFSASRGGPAIMNRVLIDRPRSLSFTDP